MRPTRIWFDSPGVRWRAIAGLVLVATLVVTLLLSYQRELWSAREVVVAVAPRFAASAVPAASAPRRVTFVAPAASLPRAVSLPAEARSTATCAAGASPDEPVAPDEVSAAALERRARESGARWIAAMQSSGDERVRAAGWLIGLAGDHAALRDRLATLAASSRDPLVQAYALRACRSAVGASSACQSLSPQAWALVEADNAAAWLAVAGDARLDAAAQLDALRQAARAPRYDTHAAALHALAQAATPAGIDELDRVAVGRQVAAARADWLGTEPLRVHCSAVQLADPERAALCERVAELLATRGQATPDLLLAREIGQRVGWPDERLDALRDEADALVALERRTGEAAELTTCGGLARQSALYADVGRLGQVGALRQALQRLPK